MRYHEVWPAPSTWPVAQAISEARRVKWDFPLQDIEFVHVPLVGECVGCAWAVPHVDLGHNPWSALLVVRSDSFMLSVAGQLDIEFGVGSIILLNIHKFHAATPRDRVPDRRKLFLAANEDFELRPARFAVEERFEKRFLLNQIKREIAA